MKKLLTQKIDFSSFKELKADEEFISYFVSGSSSRENVRNRLRRASDIIRLVGEKYGE